MRAVSLEEMLSARERRAGRQRELLAEYGGPLLCITMNIPGPVKLPEGVERGFQIACRRVDAALGALGAEILHREALVEKTGCEAYYALRADPAALKARMTALEEADDLGRLLDLDVLDAAGKKLSRAAPRRCLLCDRPAQVCGRARIHSVEALTERVRSILTEALE